MSRSYGGQYVSFCSTGRVLYPGIQRTSKNAKKVGAFMSSSSRFNEQRKVMSEDGDPGENQLSPLLLMSVS